MKQKVIMIVILVVCLLSACGKKGNVAGVSQDISKENDSTKVEMSSIAEKAENVTGGKYELNTDDYDEDFLERLKIKNDYECKSNIDSHIIAIPVENYEDGQLVVVYNNPANEGKSWYLDEDGALAIDGSDGNESIVEWSYGYSTTLYFADAFMEFETVNHLDDCTLEEVVGTNVYRFSETNSSGEWTWKYLSVAKVQNNNKYDEIFSAVVSFEHDEYDAVEMEDATKDIFSMLTWYYVKDYDLTTATNLATNEQQDISGYACFKEVLCDRLGDFGLKINSPEYITQLDYGEVNLCTDRFDHIIYLSYFGDEIGEGIESYTKNYNYYGNFEGLDFFAHKNDAQELRVFYKDTMVWYTVDWDSDESMTPEETISHFFEVYR